MSGFHWLKAGVLALALAACSTVQPLAPAADAIDKPVGAGLNIPAGSNEDFIVNIGRRLFFAENSAELDDAAHDTLDKQAAFFTDYPKYKIKIEGFSDDPGTPAANQALSLKRAQAAMAYLQSRGIAAARMRAKAFGVTRPVRKCDDVGCKAQNRRVVTVLDVENGA